MVKLRWRVFQLDAPVLGSVLDYLTMEAILRAASTARVFKSAVGHVSHLLTCDSRGVLEHPSIWREFVGAKRVVVRSCETPDDFERLLAHLFADGMPTHKWKELHVGVPGNVFEDDPSPLEFIARALRLGKLASIEDLDVNSTDTLAWDEAPDDQVLAPFEYATDAVRAAMTDILAALPRSVALRSGLHWGALDLCKMILDENPDLDVDETTPYMDPVLVMWAHSLQFGARAQHLDLLQCILARAKRIDCHGPLTKQTPLCIAAYYLDCDCVDALLAAGADPNAGDQPPLLVCAGLHARDVLARAYLGINGPLFETEADFWDHRRAPPTTNEPYKDFDADMIARPKAYRRLYILHRLLDAGVDMPHTYKSLSPMHVLVNDMRYYNHLKLRDTQTACKHKLRDAMIDDPANEVPILDPWHAHLYAAILAEVYEMSEVITDALLRRCAVLTRNVTVGGGPASSAARRNNADHLKHDRHSSHKRRRELDFAELVVER